MKLIGVHLSPFVRKVAVILAAKGIDYEQEVVIPGAMPPDFGALSPLLKIPVLVDGEMELADSSVICEYLDEKYPEVRTMPADVDSRARARFMEEYADTRLMELLAVPFRENFIAPRLMQTEPNAEKVRETVEELLPPVLDYVESRVPEQGFLFGDFCTADIALVSPTVNAEVGGYTVDAGRWPRYTAYIDRVKSHAPVAKVLDIEKQAMAAMLG